MILNIELDYANDGVWRISERGPIWRRNSLIALSKYQIGLRINKSVTFRTVRADIKS